MDKAIRELASQTSYVPPKKPERLSSNFSATFSSFNTLGAAVLRGNSLRQGEIDAPEIENKYGTFSKDALQKYLADEGASPDQIEYLMYSDTSTWSEAVGRLRHKKTVDDNNKQLQENISLTGAAAGVLLDPINLLASPAFSAAKRVFPNSPVAKYTAAGAGLGYLDAQAYNFSTGGADTVSPFVSTLLGGGLGAVGGVLNKRADKLATTEQVDREGRVLSEIEKKELAVQQTQEELASLNKVVEEVTAIKQQSKTLEDRIETAKTQDRKLQRVDLRQTKEKLKQASTRSKEYLAKANETVKSAVTNVQALQKTLTDITERAQKAKSVQKKQVADTVSLASNKVALDATETKLTTISQKVAEVKGVRSAEAKAIREEAKKQKAEYAAQTKDLKASIRKLEKKIKAQNKDISLQIKQLEKEAKSNELSLRVAEKELQDSIKARDEWESVATKDKEEYKKFSTFVPKTSPTIDPSILKLEDQLAAYGADLSDEGIERLLTQKGMLDEKLTKALDGDFSLESLKNVQTVRKDFLTKLEEDLKKFETVKDFRDTPEFASLPNWAKKALISPIMVNLASKNSLVRGLADLLHSGTINRGLARQHNAWNLRQLLDVDLSNRLRSVQHAYSLALKEGYTRSYDDFVAEVGDNMRLVTGNIQRQIDANIPKGATLEEANALREKNVASAKREHVSQNKHIQDASNIMLDYYESIYKKGSDLGMDAFKFASGKGYVNRIYSKERIEAIGEEKAVDKLVQAQREWAKRNNQLMDEEAEAGWLASAREAVRSAIDPNKRVEQLLNGLGTPKQSNVSSMKARSIQAYDDDIADLLENDVSMTAHVYATQTHGRVALQESIGVYKDDDIKNLILQTNPTPEEAANFKAMIDTIKGTREITRNPTDLSTRAIKMASSYTSAMHTLAFAIPTITEVTSLAKEFGALNSIKALSGKPSEVLSMYRHGTASDKNTIEMLVQYSDPMFNYKTNRYDDSGHLFGAADKVQEFLDSTVHKMALYGGLMPVTDMLRMAVPALTVDFLARLSVSKNISRADKMRLEDIGFTVEDLKRIRSTLQVDETGRIRNSDRSKWGKLDKDIQLATLNMLERTILDPNGITLPKFMTNMNEGQFLPRIMFKFMRFPFESYERLFIRSMQEADAKQAIAITMNVAMWYLILAAKDAVKDEEKQQYAEENGELTLLRDALIANSWTSGPIAMADTISGLTTGENITNDYQYSIGGAVTSNYQKLIQGNPVLRVPFFNVPMGELAQEPLKAMGVIEKTGEDYE